jgi:hypothetical protein
MAGPPETVGSNVGELLQTWLGVKFDQIDDLADEARSKVYSIPDQRTLWQIVGEQTVLLYALQREVTDLKAEVRWLKARLSGGRRP